MFIFINHYSSTQTDFFFILSFFILYRFFCVCQDENHILVFNS